MIDEKVVQELVAQVLSRLEPQAVWDWAQGCRTVSVEEGGDRIRFIVECGADRIGGKMCGSRMGKDLAGYIDHTLLKASAVRSEIAKLCDEALAYGFASVCINPVWVRECARRLRGSAVHVCTVVGFPLGANTSDVKAFEARRAIFDGAREIDMVINVGALKSGEDDFVRNDVEGVVRVSHEQGAIVKVILENAYLNDDEKIRACKLCKEVGADFVKTSTGFGPGGATAADVALMRRVVGEKIGVKAAGGIKDSEQTRRMIEAGATRIGASAGVKIVRGESGGEGY